MLTAVLEEFANMVALLMKKFVGEVDAALAVPLDDVPEAADEPRVPREEEDDAAAPVPLEEDEELEVTALWTAALS
jgi:hypothetical protein